MPLLDECKHRLIIVKAELYQISFEMKKLENLYRQKEIELVGVAARVEALQKQQSEQVSLNELPEKEVQAARV